MTESPTEIAGRSVVHFLAADTVALADIAFAMACNSHGVLAIGRSCAIEYLAPAFAGDALTATAIERARETRTGIYDVAVRRDADGQLLCELRAVSRELPDRPAAPAPAS